MKHSWKRKQLTLVSRAQKVEDRTEAVKRAQLPLLLLPLLLHLGQKRKKNCDGTNDKNAQNEETRQENEEEEMEKEKGEKETQKKSKVSHDQLPAVPLGHRLPLPLWS